jgi:hypothetical protein
MTFDSFFQSPTARLLEGCAEEIGRLDALVSVAPPAVESALQTSAVARLGCADAQATRAASASLVAARVDPLHEAALDTSLAGWRDRLSDGERRARSGALLALPAGLSPSVGAEPAVQAALRLDGDPRPLLHRALEIAAWLPEGELQAEAELLGALILVTGGLTDRVRLLPFIGFDGPARAEAAAAWRAGEPRPFAHGALTALAASTRQLRLQVRLLLDAQADEDAHLATIGRAAVTARVALAHLRTDLATSVPDLALRHDLSRPAAGAALERLVALGLAEEVTGRARDRVFVLSSVWGLM